MRLPVRRLAVWVFLTLLLTPVTLRAEKNTALVGVDGVQLYAGAWFTLTPRLDSMVSVYDNCKLGWGLDYHDGGRTLKAIRQLGEYEVTLGAPGGAFFATQNEAAGTASGTLTWNRRPLGVKGSFTATGDSYARGVLDARWEGTAGQTWVHEAYRQDQQEQRNQAFRNLWQAGTGQWSLELQQNQFSEGNHYLIGNGGELAWQSPADRARVAVGRFHETGSNLTEERLQLRWQDRREARFASHTLGFDTSLTGNQYGDGEAQQVGSVSGWWRRNFGHGSLRWDLVNVFGVGSTPFQFDHEDEYSCYTGARFDWRTTYHSDFAVTYDVLRTSWRTARGLVEVPLGAWSGSLAANYDFGAEYGESELVYLAMLSSPARNFTVGQSLNHQFRSLDTDVEWSPPLASGDGFRAKVSYDWNRRSIESLLLKYNDASAGMFALTYDFNKPKIMLTHSWR